MGKPFGSLFGEEIILSDTLRKRAPRSFEEKAHPVRSLTIFVVFFVVGMLLLTGRLFEVTILSGERLRKLSLENRIREEKVRAPRGIIYDRNGMQLVRNIPVFSSANKETYYEQLPVSASAESESVTRQYMYDQLFAHTIGFVGETDEGEIKDQQSGTHELKSGDIVGKTGIEKTYDSVLRGIDGKELTEADAMGRRVRVLGRIEPISGQPLTLTLDLSLQKEAQAALAGKKGAVIATDPASGEVLSLYSSPSFDPNSFIRSLALENLLSDENQPLFNRVVSGLFPPGSTFKIVTALAALESGVIDKDTKIEDEGILNVGQFSFGNWYFLQYGKKEGMISVVEALKRSNDIFFYKLGEMTGVSKISQWVKKIGLGSQMGIDIPGEKKGIIPDPVWKKEMKGQDWYLGDTYHFSIGQGDVLASPLEVNAWTNVIANDGKLCTPHVMKKQTTNNKQQRGECKDLGIKKESIELIREGMKQACDTGGTGYPLFKFKIQNSKFKIDDVDFFEAPESTTSGKNWVHIPVACKTGTAEYGDKLKRTHAWFTVFAPVHNPQISITVLVEGGGEGSSVAAPIAKKMLENWFGKKE